MAAVIGSLRVVLGADTGSFEDGLKKAGSLLTSFSKIAGGVAAGNLLAKAIEKTVAALGDMVAATFHAIDAMDKMGKESQKLGVGVEELSKLSVAAKLSDVDLAELSKSVIQLSKRMVDGADNGTAPARRAITALGISFKEFVALKPDQQMGLLADRFSQFRDGADKTAAAVALFGRAGANLIPLLNEGSGGFQKAAEMASKLGLVMTGETSAAAQKFNDNMKLVGLGLTQGIFNTIAEKILPVLVLLSEGMLKVTVGFMHFIGAGSKVDKVLEDIRKKMNLPTEEEARKAQAFTDKIHMLQVQALETAGAFDDKFAPGFVQTAVSMKLVNSEFFLLSKSMDELDPKLLKLNEAMLILKGQQITQEFLSPWEKFNQEMTKLSLLTDNNRIKMSAFALAAAKAADDLNAKFIQATAGIAGAFGDMFTTIGGEQKGWAQAAKIAAAAQALINTFQGASLALAQGGIFGFAAAAAITAAGLKLVASIKGTPLGFAQGGSFKVPGVGGMDSQMIPIMATPGERVTVETPQQQRGGGDTVIQLRGKSFGFNDIRDVFDQINAGMRDGHRFLVARA